jgi:hypothetical protein
MGVDSVGLKDHSIREVVLDHTVEIVVGTMRINRSHIMIGADLYKEICLFFML